MDSKLTALRNALKAVISAESSYDPKDGERNPMQWIRQELESCVSREWSLAQALSESKPRALDMQFAEIGSKLGNDSRAVIQGVINALQGLMAQYNAPQQMLPGQGQAGGAGGAPPQAPVMEAIAATASLIVEADLMINSFLKEEGEFDFQKKKEGEGSEDEGSEGKNDQQAEPQKPAAQPADQGEAGARQNQPPQQFQQPAPQPQQPPQVPAPVNNAQAVDPTLANVQPQPMQAQHPANDFARAQGAKADPSVQAKIAWSSYYALRDAIGAERANQILIARQKEMAADREELAAALNISPAVFNLSEEDLKKPAFLFKKKEEGEDPEEGEDGGKDKKGFKPFEKKGDADMKEDQRVGAITFREAMSSGAQLMKVDPITFLSEADGSTPEHPRYRMLVIREGLSSNRVKYPKNVLKESVPLLEGRPLYVDHNYPGQRISLATKGGWWTDVKYEEGIPVGGGKSVSGLTGTLNLFSPQNSPVPWLPGMIRESIERGVPEAVGISIVAGGSVKMCRDDQGVYKEALNIKVYASADAVAEPGAGGQALHYIEAQGVDPDVGDLTKLTINELREARPDLFSEIAGTAAKTDPPSAETAALTTLQEGQKQTVSLIENLQRQNTRSQLELMLTSTQLPEKLRSRAREEVGDQILTEDQIKGVIGKYTEIMTALVEENDSPLRQTGSYVPFGNVGAGISPLDQVVWSLEDFFGAGDPEHAGKFPKIYSFREWYRTASGDFEINGRYDKRRSAIGQWLFQEALPGAAYVVGGGTVTVPNLLSAVMNKRLTEMYKAQPRWWEPIVDKVDLTDMKTQTRVRTHQFASLTERTVDGAEYTELTWGETGETYTPTEFGNIVPVGRRAILNDDMRAIKQIPQLLSRAAVRTLNEYVAALFTANSGEGPAMGDAANVMTGGRGNKVALSLSFDNLRTARQTFMKFTDDASKRFMPIPRYVLTPIDLEAKAWEIITSEKIPESANNEKNVLASSAGFKANITVPNWTDTNNWYIMADPKEDVVGIELGFLFGKEEPELFTQDNELTGMVFTNDVIPYKVRWDFGGDWIDWRAVLGSIVA